MWLFKKFGIGNNILMPGEADGKKSHKARQTAHDSLQKIRAHFSARKKGLKWKNYFVHGEVRDPRELALMSLKGIEVLAFDEIVVNLCGNAAGGNVPRSGWVSEFSEIVNRVK
jgi:hypothetical protein